VLWVVLNGVGLATVTLVTLIFQCLFFALFFWNHVLYNQAMAFLNSFALTASSLFIRDKGFVLTGDAIDFECAIVIANHQMDIDLWYIAKLAQTAHRNQDVKLTLRNNLLYIPPFGLNFWFFDYLFISDKFANDEAGMTKKFSAWTKEQQRLFYVLLPEGKTVNTQAVELSQSYATGKNRPKLDLLLLPRTKGLKKAIDCLENVTHIYDLTIAYPTYTGEVPTVNDGHSRKRDVGIPSLYTALGADTPTDKIHIHVAKYEVEKVKENLTEFLDQAWLKKEKRLHQFMDQKTLLLDKE